MILVFENAIWGHPTFIELSCDHWIITHKKCLFLNLFFSMAIKKLKLPFDSFSMLIVSKSHVADTNSMNTEKKTNTIVSPTAHFIHISPAVSPSSFYGSPDPSVAALKHRHIFKGERPKRSSSKQRIFRQRRFRSLLFQRYSR